MKIISNCWKPSMGSREGGSVSRTDPVIWHKDLGRHDVGEFSIAVAQANDPLEDGSQIESGPLSWSEATSAPRGTFVGVYDGHGGPQTSEFVTEHLFCNLKRFASELGGMSEEVIGKAFSATEDGFMSLVRHRWLNKPQIASVGSCCLVGIISDGMLYVANAGDSRVVLGRIERGIKQISAVQMSVEHNANIASVREELHLLHPNDPQIVVLKDTVWRVKGIIQVSRSIGDAFLKCAEFQREPLLPRFRLSEPFEKPILSAEPSIMAHRLSPEDQFLIFASDGLWENLSNEEVVNMIHNSPRSVRCLSSFGILKY
ncbi:putative protein phosphatase 2C 38 [Canna indica]|uniref:protein-serine/threonine phosphatase n=1 Tax=Canna indica TaxID=4628 RepID=A0AAQ3QAH7_9LILI|nr:putative protein phosphatase 2C 38 [Canna indica]